MAAGCRSSTLMVIVVIPCRITVILHSRKSLSRRLFISLVLRRRVFSDSSTPAIRLISAASKRSFPYTFTVPTVRSDDCVRKAAANKPITIIVGHIRRCGGCCSSCSSDILSSLCNCNTSIRRRTRFRKSNLALYYTLFARFINISSMFNLTQIPPTLKFSRTARESPCP